ncbi:pilin [Comamonas sp. NLF-1-9]|nr:pilin [Comamonas sp. NLF-1-9]QXL85781.1 pilin [Comamonas sp. NLF-1-9]
MKKVQQGFTLIELMIVVAIIGILAAVALPAYQDYTVRAKISEVLLAMSSCRTSVTEVFQSGNALPAADDAAWGCTTGTGAATKQVAELHVSAAGVITAKTATGLGGTADGKVVSMAPSSTAAGTFTAAVAGTNIAGWRCGLTADGTDMPAKYLPSSCRGVY